MIPIELEQNEWVRNILNFLQHKLSKNTTIKEKKEILTKFNELTSKNLSKEHFFGIDDHELLSIYESLINFYDNMIKKNITDIIKYKSLFIAKDTSFDYKQNIIPLDKSIVTKFSDLLNFLSSLTKFFKINVERIMHIEEYKNTDLLNWILVNLIGDDYLVFKDHQENFFDLTGGITDPFKFHLQVMLSEILHFIKPNRNDYDRILESQYLILIEVDSNTKRYSNCYQNSFKILYQVLPKKYIGKVHGTWENHIVSCFTKFLHIYTPNKEDEYLFRTGFEILKISFIFNNNYREFSRLIVDLIVKTPEYIDCTEVLNNYMLFLPADIEFEINKKNDFYWLDDIYRLIKHIFLRIINCKTTIRYNFELLEFPSDYENWIKLGSYQYMSSDKRMKILAKYIMLYYKLKPPKPERDGILDIEGKNIDNNDSNKLIHIYENARVKKDIINYVMPAIRLASTTIDFINLLIKGFKESNNSEKLLLPLAFLYLNFDLPVPEKQLLNLIHNNSNIDFAEKLLFFLGLVKNKPSLLTSDSSDIFYFLILESLDNISNEKCGDICKYFIYTCIFTRKGVFYDDQMVKFNQKISNMLNNISALGPKKNNLSTFKFWQAICCFRPMFDMNLFVTTFHHIIVNWLPQIEIKGLYISLTNFIHWGFSEDKDILIKSKISLDDDSISVLKPNINMEIALNRIHDLEYMKFDEPNKSWNKGCFKNFKLIINVCNWLLSNMTSFSNKIGLLRLICFLKEQVNLKTLADIGFNKVFNYIIENLDEKQTVEEVRVLFNNYDLFVAEKLFKEHQSIGNFLNKIFKSIIYITSYDCEKGKIEFFYISEIIKSPFQELNCSDKCKLLGDMILYEFENLKFQNYYYFNIKIDNYLRSLEQLQSRERITIINELIFQMKNDINNEIIHAVDSINTQCLLLGKIIGSPILMESQSKNKMIKLWLSIFCMSSPYTQPHGLDSIKNIFKRIDVPSQVAIFNKVLNNVVYKQPIDCQYELLFKFAKISKHSFIRSITELLKICAEERVKHLSLLLKKLVNHYKKDSISELIQFAGINFMAFFWTNYYKNNLGKLFFAAMYETEISISESASLILEDKYNRTNFVASVLASTEHLGNVAALGIKELFPKDIIKTQLLINGGFDLPFECIEVFGLSSFCKLGDEASSYLQLEVELDSLAVGTLMEIVNSLCEISTNIESIKIQQLMFENENVSIYEGGGISISQMKIVENFKQVDGSSLVLKGNLLKLFSILENQDLDDDSIILTLRKIKVLYLLVEIFSQKDSFIENLRNCILKALIQIPHFKSYFKTFRSFFFAIIDQSTKIEHYITTEIFLKVLESSINLDNFEMTALEKMTFSSTPVLEISFECLNLLGYTKQCDTTTQFVEIEYKSSPVELLLRHFISSTRICHLFLSKKYSFEQQKKFWYSKFPQRYISMLDWDHIDDSFKNYMLNNLNKLSNNFKNLTESSPLANMIYLFYGKTFATHSATEEFKLNLVFCYLKTLLKNPSFNNMIPPVSFIYKNLNVHVKNGIDMTDICTILEFNKSDTAFPLDFKATDSYRVTLYSLWNKLTSHFLENTIWKCIHIIDFQFGDYSLIETSIIECFSESLDLKTFVIRHWGEWVPSLTSAIEMTKIDSKKKKSYCLKFF